MIVSCKTWWERLCRLDFLFSLLIHVDTCTNWNKDYTVVNVVCKRYIGITRLLVGQYQNVCGADCCHDFSWTAMKIGGNDQPQVQITLADFKFCLVSILQSYIPFDIFVCPTCITTFCRSSSLRLKRYILVLENKYVKCKYSSVLQIK